MFFNPSVYWRHPWNPASGFYFKYSTFSCVVYLSVMYSIIAVFRYDFVVFKLAKLNLAFLCSLFVFEKNTVKIIENPVTQLQLSIYLSWETSWQNVPKYFVLSKACLLNANMHKLSCYWIIYARWANKTQLQKLQLTFFLAVYPSNRTYGYVFCSNFDEDQIDIKCM